MGGVELVGFTCHAPLQDCLHKKHTDCQYWRRKRQKEKMKKGRGHSKVRERGRRSHWKKQTAMLHIFWAKCKATKRGGEGGKKSELYFFGCLERAQRSSSTRTRCNKTLRDEVSDRGRQGRERRKEREVTEDAARPPEWKQEWNPGGGEGDGWAEGNECMRAILGVGTWVCDSLESQSWPSQSACSQMTNTIIYGWLGRTTSSSLHQGTVNLINHIT